MFFKQFVFYSEETIEIPDDKVYPGKKYFFKKMSLLQKIKMVFCKIHTRHVPWRTILR